MAEGKDNTMRVEGISSILFEGMGGVRDGEGASYKNESVRQAEFKKIERSKNPMVTSVIMGRGAAKDCLCLVKCSPSSCIKYKRL